MSLKPWEVLLIVIGGLVGLYVFYRIDSDLPRPKKSVGQGENGENSGFWPLKGGKRKRKLRRKPRR
jgi:hypothetical protein